MGKLFETDDKGRLYSTVSGTADITGQTTLDSSRKARTLIVSGDTPIIPTTPEVTGENLLGNVLHLPSAVNDRGERFYVATSGKTTTVKPVEQKNPSFPNKL